MIIGIPREIKPREGRVALSPHACSSLVHAGHEVVVEQGAGVQSGYPDEHYRASGARIAPDAAAAYGEAALVVKVKEPVAGDLALLRRDHLLFCFLHLAAVPELTHRLQAIGLTAIGFETVTGAGGSLPILAPMSDIAGRLATQIGSTLLYQHAGGKGLLLGGTPGTTRGHVVVIGAGNAGGHAAAVAAAVGAGVTVFDIRRDRLHAMRALGNNVTALYPYPDAIARTIASADLLVAAALRPGSRAPHIVTADMVAGMQPGSVIVDISVDQGGCVETTRPTSYEQPTYIESGVVHFCVTNMPGAVPRSATQALSAVLLPYVERLATPDWTDDRDLVNGINVRDGEVVHPALTEGLD